MSDGNQNIHSQLSREAIELIARKEGDRGRNQAFAVFALLAVVISLIGLFSLNIVVGNALKDDQIEQIRLDAQAKLVEIEQFAEEAERELTSFYESGGYVSLTDRVSALGSAISSAGSDCKTVTSRSTSKFESCDDHSNFHGRATCGDREFLRSITIRGDNQDGPYRCYFVVECCNLPSELQSN